jgi:tetratricopeptide (TPR) repeat protein
MTAADPPQRMAILAAAIADLESGRFATAAAACAALLARDPDDLDALLVCGLAAGAGGDTEHAARLLRHVAAARPTAPHPCCDLTALLRRTGQSARIEPQYRAALRLAPDDAALRYAFADFLHDAGRHAEAIALLSEALALRPDFAPARNLLAIALAASGDTAAAIDELRDSVAREPQQAAAWANLGLLLKDDGRFDAALAAYDTARLLAPGDAQIRVNRVVALLRAGRWAEAWPDYEWRLILAGHATPPPRLLPMLSSLPGQGGGPALAGRTVLAVHEDGFGDTLHFARYLPLLAARGARVLACVPAALTRVMRTMPGVAAVCGPDEPRPAHDHVCAFLSLPRAFETTPGSIPAPIPYLHADPALAAAWARRLPPGALRVGLVWAGQARPSLPGFGVLDGRRSTTLATLAPLATVAGTTFISLQHGPAAAQAGTPPPGMVLHDPMPAVRDFADTAAIVANLDLVVSVDTAVLHLAGALGKPVFLLDRYDHCWRWLSGRSDSPWYPAMRIFRQARIGEWQPVLQRAAAALAAFAARSGAGSPRHPVAVDLLEVPETVERDA